MYQGTNESARGQQKKKVNWNPTTFIPMTLCSIVFFFFIPFLKFFFLLLLMCPPNLPFVHYTEFYILIFIYFFVLPFFCFFSVVVFTSHSRILNRHSPKIFRALGSRYIAISVQTALICIWKIGGIAWNSADRILMSKKWNATFGISSFFRRCCCCWYCTHCCQFGKHFSVSNVYEDIKIFVVRPIEPFATTLPFGRGGEKRTKIKMDAFESLWLNSDFFFVFCCRSAISETG